MKEQLTQYVKLLFAGARQAEDIQQEILQNTLERYDDLIAQGKTPQAAYQLSISGIGDINELLGNVIHEDQKEAIQTGMHDTEDSKQPPDKSRRAIAIFLYIISLIPLIILDSFGLDIIGLCSTLVIVAVATFILITAGGKPETEEVNEEDQQQSNLEKAIRSTIFPIGLCIYLLVSFLTQAWYITWVIFPIMGAIDGLVRACFDLKEAHRNEN